MIGAGNVGTLVAQHLITENIADVVLLDIIAGRPQGLALDLQQAQAIERCDRHIYGTNEYSDLANADIIVIAAGLPRRPGLSRDDLLAANAQIVREVTRQAIAQAPEAILLVVTNPLDVMTYLAWQTSGWPPQRVLGMGGVLDSARFQTLIAQELQLSIQNVQALVLGAHGDLMVPLPRYSTVNGVPITELMQPTTIDRLVQKTRDGGAEIVSYLKTGSAYFAPAAAVCQMVTAILQNQSRLLPSSLYLQGEYGLTDLCLGVPACLGASGVESILELALTEAEQAALHDSAQSVRRQIDQLSRV